MILNKSIFSIKLEEIFCVNIIRIQVKAWS